MTDYSCSIDTQHSQFKKLLKKNEARISQSHVKGVKHFCKNNERFKEWCDSEVDFEGRSRSLFSARARASDVGVIKIIESLEEGKCIVCNGVHFHNRNISHNFPFSFRSTVR